MLQDACVEQRHHHPKRVQDKIKQFGIGLHNWIERYGK